MFRKIAKKILTKSPKTYTSIHAANFERTHKQDFSKFDEREKELLLDVQKNGYTVIRNFFDNELCQACINDMDMMFETKKEFVHKSEYADSRIFGAEDEGFSLSYHIEATSAVVAYC